MQSAHADEQWAKAKHTCSDSLRVLLWPAISLLSGGSPALASGVTLPWRTRLKRALHVSCIEANGVPSLGLALHLCCWRSSFANVHHIWPHTSFQIMSARPLRWAMASFRSGTAGCTLVAQWEAARAIACNRLPTSSFRHCSFRKVNSVV